MSTRTTEPHNLATNIANDMLATFNEYPVHVGDMPNARAIVMIMSDTQCCVAATNYDDANSDAQMLADVLMHATAILRAHGKDLHIVPIGTGPKA